MDIVPGMGVAAGMGGSGDLDVNFHMCGNLKITAISYILGGMLEVWGFWSV